MPPSGTQGPVIPGWWAVFAKALADGHLGTLVGTLALSAICAQYLGIIDSPIMESHLSQIREHKTLIAQTLKNNTQLLTNNKLMHTTIGNQGEMIDGIWALCFVTAKDSEKQVCREGMQHARLQRDR